MWMGVLPFSRREGVCGHFRYLTHHVVCRGGVPKKTCVCVCQGNHSITYTLLGDGFRLVKHILATGVL